MSKGAKIGIAAVVILLIAGLVYWFVIKPKMDAKGDTKAAEEKKDAGSGSGAAAESATSATPVSHAKPSNKPMVGVAVAIKTPIAFSPGGRPGAVAGSGKGTAAQVTQGRG